MINRPTTGQEFLPVPIRDPRAGNEYETIPTGGQDTISHADAIQTTNSEDTSNDNSDVSFDIVPDDLENFTIVIVIGIALLFGIQVLGVFK